MLNSTKYWMHFPDIIYMNAGIENFWPISSFEYFVSVLPKHLVNNQCYICLLVFR